MERRFIACALLLGLVAPATAAAAFTSGSYRGTTAQRTPVVLKASQTTLSRFRIAVGFECTDGDRFTAYIPGRRTFLPAQNVVSVRGVGRYDAAFTGSRGASRYVNRGSILNRRVAGTFTGRRRYNARNDLDPNGTIVCTTGTVRYTARLP